MAENFEPHLFASGRKEWDAIGKQLEGVEEVLVVSPRKPVAVENGSNSAVLEKGGYWAGKPETISGEEYLVLAGDAFEDYVTGPVAPEEFRSNFVFGAKDGYAEELKVVPMPDRDYPEPFHNHPAAEEAYFVMGEALLETPNACYDISNNYFELEAGISHRLKYVGDDTSLVIARSSEENGITKIEESLGKVYELEID